MKSNQSSMTLTFKAYKHHQILQDFNVEKIKDITPI